MTDTEASTPRDTIEAEAITALDVIKAIDWLASWSGDKISFDQSTWTKNEDGIYDGVLLGGRVGATGEYIEAQFTLTEATISPAEDEFETDYDDE